ncbi:NTP transferase domain-containing protein [Bacillus cereus group sp. BfR-BA-01380]|uniref:nucleotidyltransferase family protein n=1 Tax=Bacillus cereus group sp. BfR-BA-01380 TaxID=2920324 RepID=UPI001F58C73B|nr:nucleotidyltransferase family protein [Bacillus cereus group sp. BfR-BA-01380]
MKIIGVYLAAGNSRRMGPGIHKLSLPLHNEPLGNTALKTALSSNLSDMIIVTNDASWVSQSLRYENVHILSCSDSREGQSHSLRCGVQKAMDMKADGIVVLLADQPFIKTELINELIDCYKQHKTVYYVAAKYRGIARPPVLFAKKTFPFLQSLQGDQGARAIFQASFVKGITISYEEAALFYDVNSWSDYKKLAQYYGN